MKRERRSPEQVDPQIFLTDPEAAALFRLGMTQFMLLQQRDSFPKPVWLGPRGKRHVRDELIAWALAQRERPRDVPATDVPPSPV